MKFIIFFINLVLNFLVAIGDFIIFYILFFLNIIKNISRFSKKLYVNTHKTLTLLTKEFNRYKKISFKNIKNYLELFHFKKILFLKKLRRKKASAFKKRGEEK